MQVFVRRSDLTLRTDEAVAVMMSLEDMTPITPDMLRPDFSLFSLATTAIDRSHVPPRLTPGWREANRAQIISAEATRRIDAAFPEYSQRNSAAEMMGYIAVHGANSATWPREAQQRKAEIDRAWAYVEAVRQASHGLMRGALPADPTASGHWPNRAAAYQSA